MMEKIVIILTLVASVIAACLNALPVSAIGQVTEPIEITNALRGEKYQEELTVINTEKVDIKVNLTADGDFENWVTFYSASDPDNSLQQVALGPNERQKVLAVFLVPSDVPNGIYKGNVSIARAPGDQEAINNPVVSVSQKINRQVTIEVTDTENIRFDASLIPISYDVGRGDPLQLRIIESNLGNISIDPDVHIRIVRNDVVIHDVIFPYPDDRPSIKPGERTEIKQIEISTDNLENGKYLARVDFEFRDQTILQKKFTFSVGQSSPVGIVLGVSNVFFGQHWSNWYLGYAAVVILIGSLAVLWFGRFKFKLHADNGKKK